MGFSKLDASKTRSESAPQEPTPYCKAIGVHMHLVVMFSFSHTVFPSFV